MCSREGLAPPAAYTHACVSVYTCVHVQQQPHQQQHHHHNHHARTMGVVELLKSNSQASSESHTAVSSLTDTTTRPKSLCTGTVR